MANIEHKNYGSSGSEFILHHSVVQPKRLILSLVVTMTATTVFRLYEMDATLLWGISAVLLGILLLRLLNKVRKESLLVLPSLGVQVKTKYCLGHQTTQFFDKSCIKGIIINEAVTMQSVICYLAVLLSSQTTGKVEQIYPLFTHSRPHLKDLVQVYQAVQDMSPGFSTQAPVNTYTSEGPVSPSWERVDMLNSFSKTEKENDRIPAGTDSSRSSASGAKKRSRTTKS